MIYIGEKSTWDKSGIYCIESTMNKKKYYGQTIGFRRRFYQHKSMINRGVHSSPILQKHANKYGINDLNFKVVELCDLIDLNERELFYLLKEDSLFNISKDPVKVRYGIRQSKESIDKMVASRIKNGTFKIKEDNRLIHVGNKYNLGRKHSDETKKKISEKSKCRIWTKKSKELLSKSLTGRKMSDSFKANASIRMRGNKNAEGAIFSDERKNKIRKAVSKKVEMISLTGEPIKLFDSAKEAAKYLGSDNYRNICSVCKGTRKSSLGYKWKYYGI